MGMPTDSLSSADAILSVEDADAPIAAWTLDELDNSADLASLRTALASNDDRYA